MSVILLKRCEKGLTETELDFAIRVLVAFHAGAEATAAVSARDCQGPVVEALKRGRADGLAEACNLLSAVSQECAFREQDARPASGPNLH